VNGLPVMKIFGRPGCQTNIRKQLHVYKKPRLSRLFFALTIRQIKDLKLARTFNT
jgi:NAD-dependent DNA ligase